MLFKFDKFYCPSNLISFFAPQIWLISLHLKFFNSFMFKVQKCWLDIRHGEPNSISFSNQSSWWTKQFQGKFEMIYAKNHSLNGWIFCIRTWCSWWMVDCIILRHLIAIKLTLYTWWCMNDAINHSLLALYSNIRRPSCQSLIWQSSIAYNKFKVKKRFQPWNFFVLFCDVCKYHQMIVLYAITSQHNHLWQCNITKQSSGDFSVFY